MSYASRDVSASILVDLFRYKLLPNQVSVSLEEAYMADKTRVEFDGYIGDLSDREYMKLTMPNKVTGI